MTVETSTIRKELVGMSRDEAWDLLIKRVDNLTARVVELEWEVNK